MNFEPIFIACGEPSPMFGLERERIERAIASAEAGRYVSLSALIARLDREPAHERYDLGGEG